MLVPIDPHTPPSRLSLMLESRGLWEMGVCLGLLPLLRLAPRGDGHPVLVLPGLSADDSSTLLLRAFLKDRGYAAHGWNLGMNRGRRPGVEANMRQRLDELAQRHGAKVSLVGWSLGGIFARELARTAPMQVRAVITLGSQFATHPKASNAWRLYELLSQRKIEHEFDWERIREALPVPSTAIYSRSDGVVNWLGCREAEAPQAENIEVEGAHSGLGHNPLVLYALADRLAQSEGQWRRFDRGGLRSLFFRDPQRGLPPAPEPAAHPQGA